MKTPLNRTEWIMAASIFCGTFYGLSILPAYWLAFVVLPLAIVSVVLARALYVAGIAVLFFLKAFFK